jgi:hypothetical protein
LFIFQKKWKKQLSERIQFFASHSHILKMEKEKKFIVENFAKTNLHKHFTAAV